MPANGLLDAFSRPSCLMLSVDPANGDPLWGDTHIVDGLLQRAYRVLDIVVDDLQVKVVTIRHLQQLTLPHQSLKTAILHTDNSLSRTSLSRLPSCTQSTHSHAPVSLDCRPATQSTHSHAPVSLDCHPAHNQLTLMHQSL